MPVGRDSQIRSIMTIARRFLTRCAAWGHTGQTVAGGSSRLAGLLVSASSLAARNAARQPLGIAAVTQRPQETVRHLRRAARTRGGVMLAPRVSADAYCAVMPPSITSSEPV